MAERCKDYGGRRKDGEPCKAWAGQWTDFDTGKCGKHRGTNADGSSHDGNTNAAKHGAWADSFVTDFLTDKEIARVKDAEDLLGTPESAQGVARTAAAIALEQFRRTGDDRFLRRFESICDKFGIAPADELELSGQMELVGDGFEITFADE